MNQYVAELETFYCHVPLSKIFLKRDTSKCHLLNQLFIDMPIDIQDTFNSQHVYQI